MSRIAYAFLFLVVAFLGDACRPGQRFTYRGRVYDGMTGEQVKTFTVTLQWGDTTLNGVVKDGVFTITDVPVLTDYAVTITAPGYRAFLSENIGRADQNTTTRTESAVIFENYFAVLYPDIPAPAQQIQVYLDDSAARPNGTMRLHPTALSSQIDYGGGAYAFNPTTGADASASRRIKNSLDAFIPAVTLPVTNGIVDIAEGVLTIGVPYDSDVYGVAGYQVKTNTTFFTAGNGVAPVKLTRLAQDDGAPTALFSSLQLPAIIADGSFTVTFDRPVELVPTVNLAVEQNAISAALTSNGNPANQFNVITTPNQFGVSVAVSGNTVTVKWGGQANLRAPVTTEVPPSAICYTTASMGNLLLRAVGGDGTQVLLTTAASGLTLPASPVGGAYCVAFRAPQAPVP